MRVRGWGGAAGFGWGDRCLPVGLVCAILATSRVRVGMNARRTNIPIGGQLN
jgi:hypothetical protein